MKVKVNETLLERDDRTPREQAETMIKLLNAAGWNLEMEYNICAGSNVYTVSTMPKNIEEYGIVWERVDRPNLRLVN